MNTTHKPSVTGGQLRTLMSQHIAATHPKPATSPSTPAPRPVAAPAMTPAKPSRPRIKHSVPMSQSEADRLGAVLLEAHQRLGMRLSISEIFRLGLARITPAAPITGDEVRSLRIQDGRRDRKGRGMASVKY